jgi:hypothetical protein
MLTRCLFALLALAAFVIFFSPAPGGIPESEPWLRKLLLAGIWLMGIGMAVPWGRWMPFVSPGSNLAFVSKLLGWSGASGLPYCLISEAWLAAGICAFLPLCAFALWRERAWAAWPWYAVALGAFGISISTAIETGRGVGEETDVVTVGVIWILLIYWVPVVWILCWGAIGFVLLREVTTWRRRLRSQSAGSPSTS